ncbi:hypothetical protein H9Q74_000615 [Fusarium xylarioides]|nr:hypothetical protein H9Q71_000601 [Fusarium xylarioides]KAG5829317.1 hypothetical protein H9Q74_000615 [Fusarium xylarioides]
MLSSINFAKSSPLFQREAAYELFGFPTYDSPIVTNIDIQTVHDIKIHDVRNEPSVCNLHASGFEFIKHKSSVPLLAYHFENANGKTGNAQVVMDYLEEATTLVKTHLSTDKVICFDWRLRRSDVPHLQADVLERFSDVHAIRSQAIPPGLTVHCDFSQDGGRERMEMHLLPEELEALNSGKVKAKIVNVWRPLDVVKCAPLILADRRTVKRTDVFEVQKVLPDKLEKANYLNHEPYQKWYYMSDQSPEDVAIFTTWEERDDLEFADCSPHGAASSYLGSKPRESIEVRFIVFYDVVEQ